MPIIHRAASRIAAILLSLSIIATPAAQVLADGLADEAELEFQLGIEAYQKGDHRDALGHFLASNRLVPNRNVVYNIARSFEKLGRFADAHRYYVDALQGEADAAKIKDIREAIERIAPSVAVLRIETSPPGATLYLQRRDLGSRGRAPRPLAVPEGTYTVIAELAGHKPAELSGVVAKLGTETTVTLPLERIVGFAEVTAVGASAVYVHVDDERAKPECRTPCRLELPPGVHLLYFSSEGHQGAPRQVQITANEVTRVNARMVPVTGTVVVSADERDALVEIDGRPMGFTPSVIQNVATGRRRVRVSLRGFAPIEREVLVEPNQETKLLDLRLTPLREIAAVSRFTQSIDDAPSSLTLIESQELRAFGYPTIAEALRGVRGVYLSNDRAYFSAGIRGLGEPNDYGNRVLILSDGQPLNDNLLNSSYIGSDGRVDLHDVSRIEVVRGPGSLLYGTGAFSGVVNLVPRGRDEPNSLHVSGGTYDDSVARGRAGFHYNLSPKAGLWASVSGSRSDGLDVPLALEDPGADPRTQVANRVDWHRAKSTAGRAWYGPLTAQWFWNERRQRIPVGAAGTRFNDSRTLYQDGRMMAEVRFEPKLGDEVELMARTHANRYTFLGEYSYDELAVEHYYGTWFGAELRGAWSPSKALRLTVGGEGQVHPEASLEGASGGATYLDVHQPYNLAAGYALADWAVSEQLRLSGGARLDAYSTFGLIAVPRAAVIVKPRPGSVLKVMAGRAFRAPSIYEQFYNDGGEAQAPANDPALGRKLGPESVYSGEIEFSQRFLRDWVALAAVHGSVIDGIINTIPDTPGSNLVRYANASSSAVTLGGDVELRREWRQGWMVAAYYGHQRAQFVESGQRLINAPQHLAAMRGVAPIAAEIASLAARVALEAPRRIDEGGQVTKTTAIADLTLSGNVRRYGISYVVGLYNVTNARYDYPVVADTYASRTMPQNGRTFLADLTLSYP